jgi:hypothetical protein
MQGHWVMRGTADGGPSTHDLTATWVLHHQYLELKETSREKRRDGTPVYVANVYIGWDRAGQTYACAWLDDYGGVAEPSIGRAKPAPNRLDFVFNDGDGVQFHTSMIFDPATGTWRWTMDQEEKGKFSPFARFILTRAKAPKN